MTDNFCGSPTKMLDALRASNGGGMQGFLSPQSQAVEKKAALLHGYCETSASTAALEGRDRRDAISQAEDCSKSF
jgi:hypothetical protein